MANYLDGMEGGKHNSDNIENNNVFKTYTVSMRFEGITALSHLAAAQIVSEWLLADAHTMIYTVTNEETNEEVSIDFSPEED